MSARATDQTPEGWDTTVERYDRVWSPFFARFADDALRLAGVQPGQRVLDVAAGPGTLALRATRLGATVVATDFAPGMVARLRERARADGLTHLTAEVMDGQALTLPDRAFDAACSMFGLIFFPDRAAGFRELHRVLRSGGRAAVGVWGRLQVAALLREAARAVLPTTPAAPAAVASLNDPGLLTQEMEAAGFVQVAVHRVVHDWEMATPEATWDAITGSSPVFAYATGPHGEAIRPVFIAALREECGEGPLRLAFEAHIGVGTKT